MLWLAHPMAGESERQERRESLGKEVRMAGSGYRQPSGVGGSELLCGLKAGAEMSNSNTCPILCSMHPILTKIKMRETTDFQKLMLYDGNRTSTSNLLICSIEVTKTFGVKTYSTSILH